MHKLLFLLFVFSISLYLAKAQEDTSGVFGKLKHGLKLAGQLLGIDTVREVTKLVSEGFSQPVKKNDREQTGTNLFSGFVRFLGLDSKKIGAIAVNAIVFLAQLISSTLSRPSPPELTRARKLRPGSPLDWILNSPNEKVKELIAFAKDPNLPTNVIEYLKEKTSDEESSCIQLLVCKSAPFLWGMQKTIGKKELPEEQTTRVSGMYKYLPTTEAVADYGDECEEKHPLCILD